MWEIGSEFWSVPTTENDNGLFPASVQWFLSGRCGLQSIINGLRDCHTVAMPSWCCDSMIKPFSDAEIDVHFYPVYWNNGLIQEPSLDCDALFVMDYFGFIGPHLDLSGYQGTVIRDITHSVFSITYADASYYFGSLRKWCGVWTGGYAWSKDGHPLKMGDVDDGEYIRLRQMAMEQKSKYILGRVDNPANVMKDKSYLDVFAQAECCLDECGISPAAQRDIELAQRLNVDEIRMKRRANAEVLMEAFPDWLIFQEMQPFDTPMFVPVIVPNGKRNSLRQYLIDNDIFCPVHWPVSKYHRLDDRATELYTNELSLVCDQRYTTKDMSRIVDTIKEFWKAV